MEQETSTPAIAEASTTKGLSYSFAKRHGIALEAIGDDTASLIYKPGISSQALLEVRRQLGVPIQLREVPSEQFDALLASHYEGDTNQAMEMMGDLGDDLDLDQMAESLSEPEDLMEANDDAPVIKLINAMLTEAIRKNSSDIHIEPFESRLSVRYRVDGVMQQLVDPPRAIASLITSRIKVMAKLDIAEKRLPQDGRISLRVAGRPVDIRVSTLPSGHGERIVMRLLDKQAGRLDLDHLGMSRSAQDHLENVLKLPHGIILVTGPTGSGKTTSLYAALARLNNSKTTTLTIEDPIEYYIDGIGQTQVNTKVNLDFARGLRAILRQDPDVVMVGEIRDLETAEISVQASLTGHLVLSTLHTNSAIGAVTRLRDMGVEPFLLSSSLAGIVAQRLVRLLCKECKQVHTPSQAECKTLGITPQNAATMTLYAPNGCEHCNYTGYAGRSGIYEVIPVNDQLRTMMHDGASERDMEQYARTYSQSINHDGYRRVLEGDTSLEEVLRVTREAT